MTATPDTPEIRIPVPPRVYAKLKEIAGSCSVENLARRALIDAAEEGSPSLRSSGMWSMDTGEWYSLLNPSDDEGDDAEPETAEDREFAARTTLAQRGITLELGRPFTLAQVEALAEVVKTWEG